jgi:hypothetical protein
MAAEFLVISWEAGSPQVLDEAWYIHDAAVDSEKQNDQIHCLRNQLSEQ